LEDGFHGFDTATGALQRLVDPEPDRPRNRLNDGRCDRGGRFWCGSMGLEAAEKAGTLYRLDRDLSCHAMESGVTVPNGTAFSPDDTVMYFTDSRAGAVWRYDHDPATGAIADKRVFIAIDDPLNAVDGAAVDAEGFYWGAHMRGGKLGRWDPDGRLERVVELPAGRPTMAAFGGPDFETLYVTSMSIRLGEAERAAQPLSGRLFAIRGLGVKGLPEPAFAG
jgi:sugar lactone lactonase YvrE